ncbi:head-tail connector protein [Ahrensia sp. R2A130]|uniref:head-tail connector protein n=1 Tax=Ahrensia sp. R2A130 TaxID=744979 RepID=UPI0001E0E8BE|nr:head-tail connector protein [Ahrensia sp. R2A130]EFL88956.1 bacteriophage protein [Ahrensia sp. R2A130]
MTTAIITPPALEPLTLADAKLHLRIEHADEDDFITQTIAAARQYVEAVTGERMLTQAWRQYVSDWPSNRGVRLEISPVQSVVAVTAFDREGVPHQIAPEDTELVRGSRPQLLMFSASVDPSLAANGLEIDLTVGQGDLPTDVSPALRQAVAMLVAHWYEFRGAVSPSQQPVSLPAGLDALLRPFKRVGLT